MEYLFFSYLLWPLLIIGIIGFFIVRALRHHGGAKSGSWYEQTFLSKENFASELFLLLFLFFMAVTLQAFNRDFHEPFAWETLILVSSLIGLGLAYWLRLTLTFTFSIFGLLTWWTVKMVYWLDLPGASIGGAPIVVGFVVIFLILYALGRLHEHEFPQQRFAPIYEFLGLISTIILLMIFSSQWGLETISSLTKDSTILSVWQIGVMLTVLFVSLIIIAAYALLKRALSLGELVSMAVLVVVFGSMLVIGQQDVFVNGSYPRSLTAQGIVWAIVFNGLAFFELLGLMLLGYKRKEPRIVNIGSLFLFILIFVKYFDWFFTFLDKSLFFISAGILFFAIGWLMERGRKYMLATMQKL